MRYALIGCGRIAVNHIAAAYMNQLEISAICDIDENRLELFNKKFSTELKKARLYVDYKEMLEKEKIELVAIATESGKHAQIAKDCIKAGCNVIIEKPITLSLSDADEIISLSEEKDVKVCVCHQNRFNKAIQKTREAIEMKKFGRLYHGVANIRWNRNEEYYKQAQWRGTWEQDGGALMNQCIHNIDLLRWMMGEEIDEVIAITDQLNHNYLETEDLGIAIVRFLNGSYGIIEGTTNIFPKNFEETLYLFGETGTVKVGGKSVNRIEEWIFADSGEDASVVKEMNSEEPQNVYGYGHNPLYADMIDAVKNNHQPYVDAKAGRMGLELVLAIYLSSKTGERIKLPLKDCSTEDFKGMFGKSGE